MQVTFGIRGPRHVYYVMDWMLDYSDASSILCRPGTRTILIRILVTAAPLGGITWMLLSLRGLHDPVVIPLRLLGGALAALAALHILSGLWQRIRIYRTGDALCVDTLSWIPRKIMVPISSLTGMNVLQQEKRSSRRSGNRPLGWRWRVLIHAEQGGFEFWCGDNFQRASQPPRRVQLFVQRLQRLSGLSCPPPRTIEKGAGQSGAYATGRRMLVTSPPAHTHRAFHSPKEMPPDIRAHAEGVFARMREEGQTTVRQERYTIRDSDGTVHTYQSLDEMPPEVRHRFEDAMRQPPGNP